MRSRQLSEFLPKNFDEKQDRLLPYEQDVLRRYVKRMVHDGPHPEDTYDPYNYYKEAHDHTLLELREGLTKAITEKKAQALPIAI